MTYNRDKDLFYKLGQMVALAQYGIQSPSSKETRVTGNDTLTEEGTQNILPAKGLGGSTDAGVKDLKRSTMG